MTMKVTQDADKHATPRQTGAATWRRRWWIGLLAVCLLAIGAYIFLTRAGEAPWRAAAPEPPPLTRAVPVVAAPARARDMGIYLTGLGAVTARNTATGKDPG